MYFQLTVLRRTAAFSLLASFWPLHFSDIFSEHFIWTKMTFLQLI